MERSGGPGKGRDLQQNRGGKEQGRRRAWDTVQVRTPPASTMKRTLPATKKERALRTRNPRSGGAYVVDGQDNTWRSRAPGPHAHGNLVVDGLRTEVCGQQQQSNNPRNNQHTRAPLTRKRHILPHPAQPQHTNDWAPRVRKRYQQEHRPQRPTESSDRTQHAKGRTGDCLGSRKETTAERNVTQGGGHCQSISFPLIIWF